MVSASSTQAVSTSEKKKEDEGVGVGEGGEWGETRPSCQAHVAVARPSDLVFDLLSDSLPCPSSLLSAVETGW